MDARDHEAPSIREIAELTARLRRLSAAGTAADPAERAALLADKDALLARIDADDRGDDTDTDVIDGSEAAAADANANWAGQHVDDARRAVAARDCAAATPEVDDDVLAAELTRYAQHDQHVTDPSEGDDTGRSW